jgi:O-antigen/teichoic acid export membrane protein
VKRDYTTTFLAEAIVIACYLMTFRLVAQHLGTAGFGEYALSRRALALLAPLGLMGTDMAMARFLSFGQGRSPQVDAGYPAAALVTTIGCVGILSVVLLVLQGPLAQLFFGSHAYSRLIWPLPLLLLGSGLHGVAYGYLRGRLKIQSANILVALNQGLVTLVAALTWTGSVVGLLTAIGIGWSIIATVFLLRTPMAAFELRKRIAEVVGYGSQRVPGDLLQLGLFALPSFLVVQSGDISQAGIVAFGVAAIGLVGSALTPIQFVLLPVAARHLSKGSIGELRRHLLGLLRWTIVVLAAGTIVVEVGASSLVKFYIGASFLSGTAILRLVMLGALPWGLVVTLRSVVDARHYRAVNARNMALAFGVFVLVTVMLRWRFGPSPWTAVAAFDVGLYVVGFLTVLEVMRITRRSGTEIPDIVSTGGLPVEAGPGDVLTPEAG